MQMQFQQTQHQHQPHNQTPFNHNHEQMFDIDIDVDNQHNHTNTNTITTKHSCNTDKSMILRHSVSDTTDNDLLYETTYDDDGHMITVILPDEDISNFEEVIEDTTTTHQTEDDDEYMSHVSALSPIPSVINASPEYSLHSTDDHDSAYDSSINSPPGKLPSAWSPTSSVNYIDDDYQCYDYWPQDSFSVLFPSLA